MPKVEIEKEGMKRSSRKEKHELAKKEEAEWRKKYHPPPFPSKLIGTEKIEVDDVMKVFEKVELTIPLLEVIKQMPRYAKILKKFCNSKRKFNYNEIVKVGENVSSMLTREFPLKCKDPGAVTIPCKIGNIEFPKVLLDNGVSINVLPYSIFKKLKMGDLKSTGVALQLADKSIVRPKGVLEDVLVGVKHLIFPADFYVLDMNDDAHPTSSSILFGRPFLKTSRTKLDCYTGSLTMEVDGDVIELNAPGPVDPIVDVLSVNQVGTVESFLDDKDVATNLCEQVLVDRTTAVDMTRNGSERVETKKDESLDELVKVEKDVGVVEREKKKRKRRKWKWVKTISLFAI